LDHAYLNEVKGLENPTSENLAGWLWKKLEGRLSGLKRVSVYETCTTGCHYEGR
jgi:6-pyruvoyltetrahydropterin/6-carboxytetrahydropterin synthase